MASDIFKSKEIYKNGWDFGDSKYKLRQARGFYVAGKWVTPIYKDHYITITDMGFSKPTIHKFTTVEESVEVDGFFMYGMTKPNVDVAFFTKTTFEMNPEGFELYGLTKPNLEILSYTKEHYSYKEHAFELYDMTKPSLVITATITSISTRINDSEIKVTSVGFSTPTIQRSLGVIPPETT